MTEDWNIQSLPVDEIVIPDGRRELQRAKVDTLAGSMGPLGLQSPIGVRMVDGKPHLVYGLHRLCAARELEWDSIHCRIFEGDDRRARMAEISENLHRAELTALEEAEQVAEWIRLVEELRQEISAQSAQKSGPGRPEGGLSAAAREIGVDRDAVRRAQKIAALPAEAKAAARELGLADNQAALLKAAKSPDPVLSLHQRIKQRRHTPEELALRRTKRDEQQKDPEGEFPEDEHSAASRAAAFDRVVMTLSHELPHRIADIVRDLEIGMGPNPLAEALRARHPKLFDHDDREDQALRPATGAGLIDDQTPMGAPVPGTDLARVAPLDCSDASGPDIEGSAAALENGDSSESPRAVEPDPEPDEAPDKEIDAPQIGAEPEEAEQASREADDASGEGQATWPPLPIAETAEASAEALYGQRTDASAEPLSETLEPPENDRQRVAGSETARPSSAFEALMEGLQPAAAAVQQEASQTSAEELMAIFVELKTNSKKRAPWWIERGCPDPDPEDPSVVITEALSKFRAATLKASFDERQRFLKLSASEEPQRVEDHPSRAA